MKFLGHDLREWLRAIPFLFLICVVPIVGALVVVLAMLRCLGFDWLTATITGLIWIGGGVVSIPAIRNRQVQLNLGGFITPNCLALALAYHQLMRGTVSFNLATLFLVCITTCVAFRLTKRVDELGWVIDVCVLGTAHASGVLVLYCFLLIDFVTLLQMTVATSILGTALGGDILPLVIRSKEEADFCERRILGGLGVFDGISVTAFWSFSLVSLMGFTMTKV